MPTPLNPSSSQEIIPISPPRHLKRKIEKSESTSIPKPQVVKFSRELEERVHKRVKEQEKKIETQNGAGKRDGGCKKMKERERGEVDGLSRSEITSRLLKTLGKDVNPITNSDLYSRTDHFISAATGHQQSNRGGGSAGAATYWEVRNAKMAEQAREKRTEILGGCVFYINGSTGPKVSNLMLQQMITSNGGRFAATQSSSCTHIIANGGLSGSKTQKWINGQGGRGGLKRLKIVNVDWVLDSVEKGIRLSEVGYGVIENPSQRSLLDVFAIRPTKEGTS